MTIITGEENTRIVQMMAARGAIKLEALGMKRRGKSATSLWKKHLGVTGNRDAVLKELDARIEAAKEARNAR
jgi:hypothetical protein